MSTQKDALDDPLVEEIMSIFKQNARNVTRDILSGIDMFHLAAWLTLAIGFFVVFYTILLIGTGYYQLGHWYGALGAYGSLAWGSAFVGFFVWLRRKYSALWNM